MALPLDSLFFIGRIRTGFEWESGDLGLILGNTDRVGRSSKPPCRAILLSYLFPWLPFSAESHSFFSLRAKIRSPLWFFRWLRSWGKGSRLLQFLKLRKGICGAEGFLGKNLQRGDRVFSQMERCSGRKDCWKKLDGGHDVPIATILFGPLGGPLCRPVPHGASFRSWEYKEQPRSASQ